MFIALGSGLIWKTYELESDRFEKKYIADTNSLKNILTSHIWELNEIKVKEIVDVFMLNEDIVSVLVFDELGDEVYKKTKTNDKTTFRIVEKIEKNGQDVGRVEIHLSKDRVDKIIERNLLVLGSLPGCFTAAMLLWPCPLLVSLLLGLLKGLSVA